MGIAKDLRQERYKIVTDAQTLISAADCDAEKLAQFDTMMAKGDALMEQISRIERADASASSMKEVVLQNAEHSAHSVAQVEDELVREKRIMAGILKGGMAALKPADREIAQRRMFDAQNTALSTAVTTAGGYTIAPLFFNELQVAMKAQGGMRQAARVITTATGANLPFPLMDDRSNVATIIAENTQIVEDTELTFGQTSLGGWTYKSGVMLISLQLLNDSAFDFDSVIKDAIAGRFVRGQNAHFTTGSGTGQPRGVVTAATQGKVGVTSKTTSVIYGDLVDLMYSVDPVYRVGGAWMMHDSSLRVIRKITDSQNRPLWQPGLIEGVPDTLLGSPIVTNQDMPVMAANAKSILYGNFNNYIIRDISTSMQMMVLRERYADYLQVGYICFTRSDGNLVSAANPIMYFQNSAT